MIIIARDAINNNNQLVESVWGQVEYWYNNRHYDYVSEDGDTLLPFLRNNPKFLYIYGYSLNQVGAFEKVIPYWSYAQVSDVSLKYGRLWEITAWHWEITEKLKKGINTLLYGSQ